MIFLHFSQLDFEYKNKRPVICMTDPLFRIILRLPCNRNQHFRHHLLRSGSLSLNRNRLYRWYPRNRVGSLCTLHIWSKSLMQKRLKLLRIK